MKGPSFWNEPEQFENYFTTLCSVYRSLGAQCERLGIRDEVKIQAFDGACFWTREEGGVPDGVDRMLKAADEHIDIVSIHDYNPTFDHADRDPKRQVHGHLGARTVNGLFGRALEQIHDADRDGAIEPLVAGELGTFDLLHSDTGSAVFEQRLYCAEALARLLNHGVKAVAFWVYNNNHHKYWRMLTFDPQNRRHFVPEPVNYYPLALAMKYIQHGSNIVRSKVTGLRDADGHQRVFVTVAVNGSDVTLLWVNDSGRPANVAIRGVTSDKPFVRHEVTKDACDRIHRAGDLAVSDGVQITLPPLSITVLTTYGYGSERAD